MNGRPSQLMNLEAFLLPVSKAWVSQPEDLKPIVFQFYPEPIDDTHTANYTDVGSDIIGRAEPFAIYNNGAARTFKVDTTFAAVDETYNEFWVQEQVNRLKALTKPMYFRSSLFTGKTKKFFAPPLVIFTMGYEYVNIPVVVKSVNSKHLENVIIRRGSGLPMAVSVSIELQTNYPYGWVPGYFSYARAFSGKENKFNPNVFSGTGQSLAAPVYQAEFVNGRNKTIKRV